MLVSNSQSKNVAVFGCSHSDYDIPDRAQIVKKAQFEYDQGYWIRKLCDNHPNIKFHNFARGAMGNQYIDLCMKYAMYQDPIEYCAFIVQTSGHLRWMAPVQGYAEDWFFGPTTKAFKIEEAGEGMPNYCLKRLSVPFAFGNEILTRDRLQGEYAMRPWREHPEGIGVTNQGVNNGHYFKSRSDRTKTKYLATNLAGEKYTGLPALQSKIFNFELADISQHKPIYYFNWWQLGGKEVESNIGKLSVETWLELEHPGKYRTKTGDGPLNNGTDHLTNEGNELLYNEYIMASKLGPVLTELNKG